MGRPRRIIHVLLIMCTDNTPENNGKTENCNIRNVFMAKMALLVPIPRMRRCYREKLTQELPEDAPFVHHLNASFKYGYYQDKQDKQNSPLFFTYTSLYDGCKSQERNVGITPYLLRYRIGRKGVHNYAIVLIVTVDKYFHSGTCPISEHEWCTPYDLVYLRKAIYETGDRGLTSSYDNGKEEMHDWLRSIICKVSGLKPKKVDLTKIISSTNITFLGIDNQLNDVKKVNRAVKSQYYSPDQYKTIDQFLSVNFSKENIGPDSDQDKLSNTTHAQRFIYGYLRCNDNFMQLHANSVRPAVNYFYSNNRVEGYWAVEDHILSVKVASPFVNVEANERKEQILDNGLERTQCLKELCVLSMLDRQLEQFNRSHSEMKPHEIELRRAQIAEYFNERILNVWELDHRMDYFMKRFKLDKRFRRLLDVAVPRVNARNVTFSRIGSIISWTITFLSLIIAILTLIKE